MKYTSIILAVVFVFLVNINAEAYCTISQKRMNINHEYFKGTIVTPIVELSNKTRAEHWNQKIESFQTDFLKLYQHDAISKSKSSSMQYSNQFPYKATMTYTVPFCNIHYISIVGKNEIIKGKGAKEEFQYAYNIDAKTGEEMKLQHIFQNKEKALETIKIEITEMMNKEKSRYNRLSIDAIRKMEQFSFYIAKDVLVVYVPEAALENEREGISEFKIPFSRFSKNINTQFMEKINQR